jgi:long-subunit acyl-CoA synthetase (AMP-forming)
MWDYLLFVRSSSKVHVRLLTQVVLDPSISLLLSELSLPLSRIFEEIKSILEEERKTTPQIARDFLGLQDCRVLLTAGVAVPVDLLEYFERLNMPLTEAYGMTENTGGITVNCMQQLKMGSVGKPYPGTYVRIDKPDRQGNGEVLLIGLLYYL